MNRYTIREHKYDTDTPMSRLQELEDKIEDGVLKEVRLGKAICQDHDEWWGAVYECSLCGNKWMLECSSYKAVCCPWCGADMRKESAK